VAARGGVEPATFRTDHSTNHAPMLAIPCVVGTLVHFHHCDDRNMKAGLCFMRKFLLQPTALPHRGSNMHSFLTITLPMIRPPISSHRRLRSSQHHDLFMPRVRTTMAQTTSFASIGQSLCNHLPPLFCRLFILSAPLSSSLSHLKSYLFHGTNMH